MGPQVNQRRRQVRLVATVLVAVLMAVAAVAASAASLNGINGADLFAWSTVDSPDLPLAYDHFDDCNSGVLNGDPPVVGNDWAALNKDWRCQVTYSRTRNRNQATLADSAFIDVSQSDDLLVSAYLMRASRTAAGAGSGLALFHDGSADHMYVVYQRGADQITIGKVVSGVDTQIASVSYLPRTNTMTIAVDIAQPTLDVLVNGSSVLTHTMTAGELTTFSSNTRFGVESDFDRRSQWDWFEVLDQS